MAVDDRAAGRPVRRDLPVFLTSFVGRCSDIEEAASLVGRHRMVTVTGPGGIGKTRLAVKLVEGAPAWPDGVGFVDYSGAEEMTTAFAEVASALGLTPMPGLGLEEQLVRHLSSRKLLLLLDNCEQVVDTVRRQATLLLQRCPGLRILATSRERLGVPGEVLYRLSPLPTPAPPARPDDGPLADDAAEYEALKLFEERAAANQPDFRIEQDNLATVARVCAQLDGVPLAIELAAARLRMMSLRDLEEGLHDRFNVLSGGESGRHESLSTTIDWSCRLLTEKDRRLFNRISVFSGGFRLDAVAAVVGDPVDAPVEAIGNLVDKSLVQHAADPDGHTRYRMLNSIREYGLATLRESGELDEVHDRHLTHYLAVAREASRYTESPSGQDWLDRLQADHDNMVVALGWAYGHAPAEFVELVTCLGWYWHRRGHPAEGRRWLEMALDGCGLEGRQAIGVLRWATTMAAYERDMATAERSAVTALRVAEQLSDDLHVAHARLALGNIMFHDENPARRTSAREHYEEAYRLYEAAGAPVRCVAAVLNLSIIDLAFGRLEEARRHAERALQVADAHGRNELAGQALIRLGLAAFLGGDDHGAEALIQRSLERWPPGRLEAGGPRAHRPNGLYISLLARAALAARRGMSHDAARLAGAAAGVADRDVDQAAFPKEIIQALELWQERARQAMGPIAFRDRWESGRTLGDVAAARLLVEPDASAAVPLSGREMEIVRLVAEGLTNRRIGSRLGLSIRTVDAHLDHIRNKLGLRTRAQIVRWLVEGQGPIELERREASG